MHRVFGSELSPYSVKVRSYFRYKEIPHEWVLRSAQNEEEFRKYARLPLIPLVVTPDGEGIQDSTPIIERFETEQPEPSIHPDDPAAAFLSALLEEFADEWGNKWMFHYRWARDADQESASRRIAEQMTAGAGEEQVKQAAEMIRARMVDRVGFVGSNETTAPLIEESFREAVDLLDAHLKGRPYCFGARPALADFGLWGQIYNAWTDPTPHEIVERNAPNVLDWIHRMLEPKNEGPFEPFDALEPTLVPILDRQVGRLFLPWSDANAKALEAGRDELTVDLDGRQWVQKPQKYHAKSLREIRRKYAEAREKERLAPLLDRTGCLPRLA